MPSFDAINYSLRPSKAIQRQLIFEGAQLLQNALSLNNIIYVGFGSIWFTDFVLAQKTLHIKRSVSIEGNEVGFRRAQYNAPYATVDVIHGLSNDVLPGILGDDQLNQHPWMVWLDYDFDLNESIVDDIRLVIEQSPVNTFLLITFNGVENKYGKPNERAERIRTILGSVVPDDLSKDSCKDIALLNTLADLTLARMASIALDSARPGGFLPAFRIIYKDGAPMVTVGGVLPSPALSDAAAQIVSSQSWPCCPERPIHAPHLTIKEAAALQAQLPCLGAISRGVVQNLGFDLEQEQIEVFESYYLRYPAYAQIVS